MKGPRARYCIPRIVGRRGAGLGNELNAWAKAYIASVALGARLLHPAWGLNPRPYRRLFESSRLDWAGHAVLRGVLPHYEIGEADFQEAYEQDFRHVVRRFAEERDLVDRRAFALSVGGMWGGNGILREAYPFVRQQLLGASRTVENLGELQRRLRPDCLHIAMHVRRGDFLGPGSHGERQGVAWNEALPLDWYMAVGRSLRAQLEVDHQFILLTDGSPDAVEPLLREFAPVTTFHHEQAVCSDLLALSSADVAITSVSSFSMWAVSLSDSPYVWHGSNVVETPRGLGLWPQGRPLFERLAARPRGVLVGDDGEVPASLVEDLHARHARRGWGNDLVRYGRIST